MYVRYAIITTVQSKRVRFAAGGNAGCFVRHHEASFAERFCSARVTPTTFG